MSYMGLRCKKTVFICFDDLDLSNFFVELARMGPLGFYINWSIGILKSLEVPNLILSTSFFLQN
jgi:hypothetical protein